VPSWGVRIIEDTVTPVLAKLPHNIQVGVHGTFQDVGGKMKGYAESICRVRTGYLRSTIHFTMLEDLNYEFGADADYASYVELGTWKTRAQPFIRPAFEAYLADINQSIVDALMKAVGI
jgi:HK97 gp10 family phage protein